jgi:hypothetical protein
MKKEYLPYYISRTLFSVIFPLLIFGVSWKAGVFAIMFIGLFILYLHSGWFEINLDTPFTPLRRDWRGKEIQRKALIAALVCGLLFFVISPYISSWFISAEAGYLALVLGIVVYFGVQFTLMSRS